MARVPARSPRLVPKRNTSSGNLICSQNISNSVRSRVAYWTKHKKFRRKFKVYVACSCSPLPSLHRSRCQDVWFHAPDCETKAGEAGGEEEDSRPNWQMNWNEKCLSCACAYFCELDKVSSATTKDSSLPPKVAPCYAFFEMPIRFAIEFAVNRQPQIESGVMWKLENVLNAICEFKRSLLTTDGEQRLSSTKTRLCWLWERRIGAQSGRRKLLCFLSDITGPVHSSRSRKLSRGIRIHKTIFRDPSM